MNDLKIVGYKKIFGIILPDWVSEKMIKTFAFGLLTTVVIILTYIFAVSPRYEDIANLQKDLEKSKIDASSLLKSLEGIKRVQESISENSQAKILSAVPMTYSPERTVYVLRELARETGASIVSYTLPSGVLLDSGSVEGVGKRGEMLEFASTPIKITVSAPVDILLKFISKLENSIPFGVVSDLNLQEVTKLAKGGVNKNVQIALEIKYFQVKLNKININNLLPLTQQNLDFAEKLGEFDEITVGKNESEISQGVESASISGNIFGL
jgi:hypothetical protein